MIRRTAITSTIAGVLLCLAQSATAQPPAEAQQPAQAQQPPAQSQPGQPGAENQAPISDAKLQQFTDAVAEVQAVQQEYAQAVEQAESQEDVQTLRTDAQQEMQSAVEDTGLSVPEFNLIAQRLQSDPQLVQRLQELSGS